MYLAMDFTNSVAAQLRIVQEKSTLLVQQMSRAEDAQKKSAESLEALQSRTGSAGCLLAVLKVLVGLLR